MQYTINELYDRLLEKVNNVYDVFKGFFGECHVDLQSLSPEVAIKHRIMHKMSVLGIKEVNLEKNNFDIPFDITDMILEEIESSLSDKRFLIYVWWPSVTVTNENNKSIDIQDLYAKIEIGIDGRIPYENYGFLLNRATYTTEQFSSNYLHSHVRDIPKYNFAEFQEPCMGTGPIRETIGTLKNDYDKLMWMLFCQELSMYVTVESLKGVPYKHLEQVGSSQKLTNFIGYNLNEAGILSFTMSFPTDVLKSFIKYYLEKGHLTLSYKNGNFTFGMPYHEYIIDISNSFIEYYNLCLASTKNKLSSLFLNKLLYNAKLIGNEFYGNTRNNVQGLFDMYEGKRVLTFKGKEIKTKIIGNVNEEDSHLVILIDHKVAMYILRNILRTINYRYTNEYYRRKKNYYSGTTTCEVPTPTTKRVIYI